jgi:hypothetical protein
LRLNFVLIDFENVQPKDISVLNGGNYRIKVFLGAKQAKIPVEMARALQAFGPDVEYIQTDGGGSNALDFHVAYYIGRLTAQIPDACFHVISKDGGFDPLIKHLSAQGVLCRRLKSISEILLEKIPNSGTPPERLDAVIDNLARRKSARPRTLKTLRGTINSLFVNQLTNEELDGIIEELTQRAAIRIDEGKVHYDLPS